jgi:hypothetical protein
MFWPIAGKWRAGSHMASSELAFLNAIPPRFPIGLPQPFANHRLN